MLSGGEPQEVVGLREEVARLQGIEAQRDLLLGDLEEVRHVLSRERQRYAELREAADGLAVDLSHMESRIRELSGLVGADEGWDT